VAPQRRRAALEACAPPVRAALEAAADDIAAFQRNELVEVPTHHRGGVHVRTEWRPVERAGAYVPGGLAAYPSTVLMTVVPARVAGVDEVVVCVPPGPDGSVAAVTLAAAEIAGADVVVAVGGAQAVAAMAYGTESVPAVDVIVGPGNRYVATAKREVAGVVGVPSAFTGPSEVVVVADDSVDPGDAAIDIVLQAEHGPDGLGWLVCWDAAVADAVEAAIETIVAEAPRAEHIRATLAESGYAVVVDDPAAAVDIVNRVAPEHVELLVTDPEALVPGIRHAGAVFCGALAPASIGDYIAGPSHVLPTARSARFGQALTVHDFRKAVHIVTVDPAGLARVGPHVVALAEAEGLDAHAESVRRRLAREAP
jgi:histidinol dehydrogenase